MIEAAYNALSAYGFPDHVCDTIDEALSEAGFAVTPKTPTTPSEGVCKDLNTCIAGKLYAEIERQREVIAGVENVLNRHLNAALSGNLSEVADVLARAKTSSFETGDDQ